MAFLQKIIQQSISLKSHHKSIGLVSTHCQRLKKRLVSFGTLFITFFDWVRNPHEEPDFVQYLTHRGRCWGWGFERTYDLRRFLGLSLRRRRYPEGFREVGFGTGRCRRESPWSLGFWCELMMLSDSGIGDTGGALLGSFIPFGIQGQFT